MSAPFDGVLILGKELRHDPQRARRELQARAAAAAALVRAGAEKVYTLEAHLKGQSRSGSALVAEDLAALNVPSSVIHREDRTCSTREEAVRGAELFAVDNIVRPIVITARYHIERVRWHFCDLGVKVTVQTPEGLWRFANEAERAWIDGALPTEETLAAEAWSERTLFTLARSLLPLPRDLRSKVEIRWGRRLRDAGNGV